MFAVDHSRLALLLQYILRGIDTLSKESPNCFVSHFRRWGGVGGGGGRAGGGGGGAGMQTESHKRSFPCKP